MSTTFAPFVRMARSVLLGLFVMGSAPRAVLADVPMTAASGISMVTNGELAAAVVRARDGARRRLGQDSCAQVFRRFSDARGRSLHDVLATRGLSPADSVARLVFRNGDDALTCRLGPVAAFTSPGSSVVFVCGKRFGRMNSQRAELVVVHELLHAAGLRERPPLPGEIDQAVASGCDR
jgi:hypothetical protein